MEIFALYNFQLLCNFYQVLTGLLLKHNLYFLFSYLLVVSETQVYQNLFLYSHHLYKYHKQSNHHVPQQIHLIMLFGLLYCYFLAYLLRMLPSSCDSLIYSATYQIFTLLVFKFSEEYFDFLPAN